jgi:hypothetical protein
MLSSSLTPEIDITFNPQKRIDPFEEVPSGDSRVSTTHGA